MSLKKRLIYQTREDVKVAENNNKDNLKSHSSIKKTRRQGFKIYNLSVLSYDVDRW